MRKIPEDYYQRMRDFFSNREFQFDKSLNSIGSGIAFGTMIKTYYPQYQGDGVYVPFTKIEELREFGEELIKIQSSPLWKALS